MFNLGVPVSSEGGHVSFQNNVPDPVASGKELPTFKFELEKSEGRVVDALATNFGQNPSIFEKFPRRDVFITR